MTQRNNWTVDWKEIESHIVDIREAVDEDAVPDEFIEAEAYEQFMDVVT